LPDRAGSDRFLELVEGRGEAEVRAGFDAELVVAARRFRISAWPAMTTAAVLSVFRPRMGLSRALSRPMIHSTRLLTYWSVLWNTSGNSSSITDTNAGARSVTTSAG
jgi:hypothetical protein